MTGFWIARDAPCQWLFNFVHINVDSLLNVELLCDVRDYFEVIP